MLNQNTINSLAATNEILSSILSANVGGNIEKLKSDASGYLAENYGVDASAIAADVSVVENNAEQVHLTLPYYAELEKVTAEGMQDDAVDVAGGFEIFTIIAIAIAGAAAASAVGVAGITYGAVKGAQKNERNK